MSCKSLCPASGPLVQVFTGVEDQADGCFTTPVLRNVSSALVSMLKPGPQVVMVSDYQQIIVAFVFRLLFLVGSCLVFLSRLIFVHSFDGFGVVF